MEYAHISLSVGGCLPERDKMQLGGSYWSWIELSAMGGLESGNEDVPCVTTVPFHSIRQAS